MKWLKRKILNWLGIYDPNTYMAVDIGYHDQTAVVIAKKSLDGRTDLVEIINFPPGVRFQEIKNKLRGLRNEYGISRKNVIKEGPPGFVEMMDREW